MLVYICSSALILNLFIAIHKHRYTTSFAYTYLYTNKHMNMYINIIFTYNTYIWMYPQIDVHFCNRMQYQLFWCMSPDHKYMTTCILFGCQSGRWLLTQTYTHPDTQTHALM